jgi:hypothetical protein
MASRRTSNWRSPAATAATGKGATTYRPPLVPPPSMTLLTHETSFPCYIARSVKGFVVINEDMSSRHADSRDGMASAATRTTDIGDKSLIYPFARAGAPQIGGCVRPGQANNFYLFSAVGIVIYAARAGCLMRCSSRRPARSARR